MYTIQYNTIQYFINTPPRGLFSDNVKLKSSIQNIKIYYCKKIKCNVYKYV